jgi:hypothetical protein
VYLEAVMILLAIVMMTAEMIDTSEADIAKEEMYGRVTGNMIVRIQGLLVLLVQVLIKLKEERIVNLVV